MVLDAAGVRWGPLSPWRDGGEARLPKTAFLGVHRVYSATHSHQVEIAPCKYSLCMMPSMDAGHRTFLTGVLSSGFVAAAVALASLHLAPEMTDEQRTISCIGAMLVCVLGFLYFNNSWARRSTLNIATSDQASRSDPKDEENPVWKWPLRFLLLLLAIPLVTIAATFFVGVGAAIGGVIGTVIGLLVGLAWFMIQNAAAWFGVADSIRLHEATDLFVDGTRAVFAAIGALLGLVMAYFRAADEHRN